MLYGDDRDGGIHSGQMSESVRSGSTVLINCAKVSGGPSFFLHSDGDLKRGEGESGSAIFRWRNYSFLFALKALIICWGRNSLFYG